MANLKMTAQVKRQLHRLAHRQSYHRAYGTLHHICNRRVKHSVKYISFARDYTVQINRGFSLLKPILGRNHKKGVAVNLQYDLPVFQFL